MCTRKVHNISVIDEPEHLIPFQDSPQGSPPLDFQPVSCEGEFKLLYITLRAETAKTTSKYQYLQMQQNIITDLYMVTKNLFSVSKYRQLKLKISFLVKGN